MTLRSSDLQSDSDLDSIRNSCDVLFCCLAVSVIDRLFLHFFGCCFSIFLCICVCLLVFLSMFFHLFELPFLWEEEAFILLFLGAELELPGSYKQVGTWYLVPGIGVERNQNRNIMQEAKFLFSPQDCRKYQHTVYNCQEESRKNSFPVHLFHFHFLKKIFLLSSRHLY